MKSYNYKLWSRILIFFNIICLSNILSQVTISEAFPNLTFTSPVDIQANSTNDNLLFVVSQIGQIHAFENKPESDATSLFLDISDKVLYGNELGLLGLAFHPNYSENGHFFINYTTNNPRRTVISRFTRSDQNINEANPSSEKILLEVEQPYSNHNGGQLTFGPDGYLYISFGDGGSGGDPENRAQNLKSFLGKIIRINIDKEENGINYAIPESNLFKNNTEGILEEIYAYGLRNVWRFSFDNQNRLWAADVGQNKWEEINIVENGGNYGWRIMEGNHCYNPQNNCDQSNLKLPVWEYPHGSNWGYSITGGYFYEGNNLPEFHQKYIYADYVSGNIWAFDPHDSTNSLVTKYNGYISTFGIDKKDNLYLAEYTSGKILKFTSESTTGIEDVLPRGFELYQNYPNPFNPNTMIKYSLSANQYNYVKLTVYDVLGNEIETLVKGVQPEGIYEIDFDGSNLSSGIYFYVIRVGDFIKSKKMTLIK